jgi:hypothetical protein
VIQLLPEAIEPDVWVVAFHRTAASRWLHWLAIGPHKHVSAHAWVSDLRLWVIFDLRLDGTHLVLLPDSEAADRLLADRIADADLVVMPRKRRRGRPVLAPFYCVPAIKHLLGLSCGALRPTALLRHCLESGGQRVDGTRYSAPDQSGFDARTASGTASG